MGLRGKAVWDCVVFPGVFGFSTQLGAQSQIEELVVWGCGRDQNFANLSPKMKQIVTPKSRCVPTSYRNNVTTVCGEMKCPVR